MIQQETVTAREKQQLNLRLPMANSFCGNLDHQTSNLAIATARAGNVIGGGDWA